MAEDRSLDVAGVGKLADAIPDEAWNQIVNTACHTFKELISPITASTGGLGRLINARFDRLVETEKILATNILKNASQKASGSSSHSMNKPNIAIILKVIESSSAETDETLQELWSNLLANELSEGSVHPEFIQILSRLSSKDAYRLVELAQRSSGSPPQKVTLSFKVFGFEINLKDVLQEPTDFTNIHLSNLGLIERPLVDGINEKGKFVKKAASYWQLTVVGEEFILAVSNPSLAYATTESI